MRLSVILAGLALSGCAGNQFQTAIQQCHQPPGPHHYVETATCINAVSERMDHTIAGQVIRATRMQLADKVDRGEMRSADAAAELAQVSYNVRLPQQQLDQRNREMWAGVAAAGVLSMTPPPQVNTTVVVPRY